VSLRQCNSIAPAKTDETWCTLRNGHNLVMDRIGICSGV
jgi:hypothetical protein